MATRAKSALNPAPLKIVLIGKARSGKSSLVNTIFAENGFKSDSSPASVTRVSQKVEGKVDGREVTVVDTPGLFHTTMTKEEVNKEVLKGVNLLAPGPHAFLLVIKGQRITQLETEMIEYVEKLFGKEAKRFTLVMFTHGDEVELPIKGNDFLVKMIAECGDRCHVVNNRAKADRGQVKELLEMIDEMVEANKGECYTNDMLREAEALVEREVERIRRQEFKQSVKKDVDGLMQLQQRNMKGENVKGEMKLLLEKIRDKIELLN